MGNNLLLRFGRNTAVVSIVKKPTAGDDDFSAAHYTMRLTGNEFNLKAAKKLIMKAAEENFVSYQIQVKLEKGKSEKSYNLIVHYEGNPVDGAVDLLSLVHKATQCDIGASVRTEVSPGEGEPRQYMPGIVVDCTDITAADKLRPYVITYLERELSTMSELFRGEEPVLIAQNPLLNPYEPASQRKPRYNKIYQFTGECVAERSVAQTRAMHLAEQVSAALGIPDAAVTLDVYDKRGGYDKGYEFGM